MAAFSCCRLKRAGLDYWASVCVDVHPSWDAFYQYWQQQRGPKQLVGEPGAAACAAKVAVSLHSWLFGAVSVRSSCGATPHPAAHAGYSKFATHHFAAEGLYPPGTSTWLMFGAEVRINLLAF